MQHRDLPLIKQHDIVFTFILGFYLNDWHSGSSVGGLSICSGDLNFHLWIGADRSDLLNSLRRTVHVDGSAVDSHLESITDLRSSLKKKKSVFCLFLQDKATVSNTHTHTQRNFICWRISKYHDS